MSKTMSQPRIPIPPAGPSALHRAAAGGHDDTHAPPPHRRIHRGLAREHDEATVQERVWPADPALADAGLPVLAVGTGRPPR